MVECPIIPCLTIAQKDSIPLTCACPLIYSPTEFRTVSWLVRPPYEGFSLVYFLASLSTCFSEVFQSRFGGFRYRTGRYFVGIPILDTDNLLLLPLSSACLFFSLPPKYVSSISTGHSMPSIPANCFQDPRSLCTMSHAELSYPKVAV